MEVKIENVEWKRSRIALLYPALQRGVLVKVRLGGNLRSLLVGQLGLDPDYVKRRIQTAFLNGKPVDDFDEAVVGDGATLTLSGALPGLAGATLRKGGFYSSLRASVSYIGGPGKGEEMEGFLTIRVFNLLLPELAPVLLARGLYFSRKEFVSLAEDLGPSDRGGNRQAEEEAAVRALSEATARAEKTGADFIFVRSED
jgi:hypothetical protein